MKKLFKFILPILIIGLSLGLYRNLLNTKAAPEPVDSQLPLPVVAASMIKKQNLTPELTLFGRVEAPDNSVLRAGISADVMEVWVQEGGAVKIGETLVRLDDTDASLNVIQRRAGVEEIRAQMESDNRAYIADQEALEREQSMLELTNRAVTRARKLAESSAGTQATLDEALKQEEQLLLAITQRRRSIDDYQLRQKLWQARLEHAGAALKHAEQEVSRTMIRAPYSGRVIEVQVSPGDRVQPGNPLVRLFNHLNLEIRAQVPRRHVSNIREALSKGQTVTATLEGQQGNARLTLDRLSAAVTEGQAGVDAFFVADPGVLPALGSTVELLLTLPELANAVALPPDALFGNDRVYRVVDGKLESLTVSRLGQRRDSTGQMLLIVDGEQFKEKDLVMITRLPQAIDGLNVETETISGE